MMLPKGKGELSHAERQEKKKELLNTFKTNVDGLQAGRFHSTQASEPGSRTPADG